MGFLDKSVIPVMGTLIIPDADFVDFGIVNSNVHMAWMRAFAGRLEMRYRYSKDIVYNTFPWPKLTKENRAEIERTANLILSARALYKDSTLADLYDELTMPIELRNAHRENNKAVMKAFGFNLKMTEEECVAELMKLYKDRLNQ